MNNLSKRSVSQIAAWYRRQYGLRMGVLRADGDLVFDDRAACVVDRLRVVEQARQHALKESVRWGTPYAFFMAPGVISWVVPLVNRYTLVAAILGGEVLTEGAAEERAEAIEHLVKCGAAPRKARAYVESLAVWPHARCQEAMEALSTTAYQVTGFRPDQLRENRERHEQQRQIAEEIHRRKRARGQRATLDEEQELLSLIRAADQKGARSILNKMLGRVFIQSSNLSVIRARVVEMMGYLVRRAIEDSPFLEPILQNNHQWMARVIDADSFEQLASVVREALDDFIRQIYQQGYAEKNPRVQKALHYLEAHYHESVTLKDVAAVAGVSPFRIAHLVKQETGMSIIGQVHLLRIRQARRLLETSTQSCADIAFEVGFCDQSYFTRQFRAITGCTPARYRRQKKSGGAG